jgi:hypothetical protein
MDRRRVRVLAWLAVAATAVAVALPPLAQDLSYHDFADQRSLFGVANITNVLSNAPFAVVGMLGLAFVRRARPAEEWQRTAAAILFAAVFATPFGSAWYHLAPANQTLFWDRLPMAVAFMALFALVTGEEALAWPLILAGAASVVAWRITGDLRPYALVQFFPMLAIPVLMALDGRDRRNGALIAAMVWYAAAKVLESLDSQVYALGGVVSGHTLKHLAAAAATAYLLRWAAASLIREEGAPPVQQAVNSAIGL